MKTVLEKLFSHHTLSYTEAKNVLLQIGRGDLNTCQTTSFLTVFQMRSITVNELSGFRDALLELCLPVDLSEYDPIDLCGTGGDGKDTFNISTLASFVVAGAGISVAKHGNYSVSSSCGSSDVVQHLGYRFSSSEEQLKKELDYSGICFLHAPLFHPAMKLVAPIRKELKVKTFFNMLGPMVNPSRPNKQIVGVFSLELARLYQYLYQQTPKQYSIIHALDGYDEISLTSPFKHISNNGDRVLSPSEIGLEPVRPEELYGGNTVKDAADLFIKILNGKGTSAQNRVVLANAATAISTATALNFSDSYEQAQKSLSDGAALRCLNKLIETSKK
ncbi:anthranilate phosphoribosyltransferase [Owenweeksia hongkongensis DSM 17368]|uniref:Anthranilate phosphoribosyltransferase n=1 Tax=Owenweeksia hongkongensis (strain DSM 17368 / CIP 108786 / JCM 12287 / NRRL B-23963 / UST20020801) TaxID=926562 RepID=G8R336_OWEHD|nr:anthranilate phosphoribosyltransferase [Owenweeksia hongkongensis]AEV34061.1 anthranilate phosphoribosyltransferase [Owenweeksia hongkongensis DSM 17368]